MIIPETDDFFMVLSGELMIDLPDGTVTLRPGEVFVVPRGCSTAPGPRSRPTCC